MRAKFLSLLFHKTAEPSSVWPPEDTKLSWSDNSFAGKFNKIWPEILREVPYWRETGNPRGIRSYSEFCEFPLLHRIDLQRNSRYYHMEHLRGSKYCSTGGSMYKPLQFRLFKSELEIGRRNQFSARRQYGIEIGDQCFLMWGDAAEMDGSITGRVNEAVRRFKDKVLGYCRLSAYKLSPEILRTGLDQMIRVRAKWIYAYGSCLLAMVRANEGRQSEARKLGLKACVAASESLDVFEKKEIAEFFNCPVAMEYGSVEMRICAHTVPGRPGYFVFTDDYLVEALPTQVKSVYEVAVTKLYRAAMPLIRYIVGDQIVINDSTFSGGPVVSFDDVLGRSNDNLVMEDGTRIHEEAICHAVRSESQVLAYQLHTYPGHLELHLSIDAATISDKLSNKIRERLCRIHPAFSKLKLLAVRDVITTAAGKRRWIVRHTTRDARQSQRPKTVMHQIRP